MSKIDKEHFHKEHSSRNLGLLTSEDQEKIINTTLLVAGCGVGSQVALSAARIGFSKFVLIDGDTVELSNTNRQSYNWRDVGKFKVDALSRKIKAINPHAKVKKFPIFMDIENAAKLVKKADIVIDSIDPTAAEAVIAMHRAARKQDKPIIQPIDVGWGAMLQVFTPESLSYEEMIGLNPKTPLKKINKEESFAKFIDFFVKIMPPYVQELAMAFIEGKKTHYPQPVSAAYTLSAMTVLAAKRLVCGQEIKTAPDYIMFDPDTVLAPEAK